MARNLVVCIDGTGNEFSADATNVLRLCRVMIDDGVRQTFFYEPGVGTQGADTQERVSGRLAAKLLGLVIGFGLERTVANAYAFLMREWEPDDRIYLFGFSRGAYAARVLAGLLGKIGILEPGRENLIPSAIKLYLEPENVPLAAQFSAVFARRPVEVHFLGLWDTVKSVIEWPKLTPANWPRTFDNASVRTVRHAIAIDERRRFYRTNRWTDAPKAGRTDVRQMWFAGVHSDVGGSYPEPESGLSKIALRWMLDEAIEATLLVDDSAVQAVLPPAATPEAAAADPRAPQHRSLKGLWWVLEWLPRFVKRDPWGKARYGIWLPLGAPRYIPQDALLHESVEQRLKAGIGYTPPNLPTSNSGHPSRQPPKHF